jgi:hypothetical protein
MNFLELFEKLVPKVFDNVNALISDNMISLENPKIIARPVLTKIVEILTIC